MRRVVGGRCRCGSARSSARSPGRRAPAAPRAEGRARRRSRSSPAVHSRSPASWQGSRALLVGELLRVALQRVVERLGRREEPIVAADHLPVGDDAEVVQQRHGGAQQLRDAAAVAGGVHVQDARAAQWLCARAKLLEQAVSGDAAVVLKRTLADVNGLQHPHSPRPRATECSVAPPADYRCAAQVLVGVAERHAPLFFSRLPPPAGRGRRRSPTQRPNPGR